MGASCTELVFTRTDAELQIGKSKIIFLLVIEFVKMIPDVENQWMWVFSVDALLFIHYKEEELSLISWNI